MSRILGIFVMAGLANVLETTPAAAQFPFSPERIFGYYDRNGDGELDREEMERVRGPLRETLERSGRRSVDRDEFTRVMEQQREGGDRERDRRDGRRDSDRRSGRAQAGPKLRERVTLELPSKYTEGDHDGDGQIGLYEWIQWKSRAAIGEFLALDRNRDGFLEPYELNLAEKANGGPANGNSTAGERRPTGTSTTTRSNDRSVPAGDRPRLDDQTARIAREAFGNLAGEDGRISEDEWQRSQATRIRFQEAGVELKLPADLDTFLAAYPAEQNTVADTEASRDATPPPTRNGGEAPFRRFSRGSR